VVSVPADSGDAKIRTCRYTVVEENVAREVYTGTSFVTPAPGGLYDEDYDDGYGDYDDEDDSIL
jgi:hypothetical protein